jgi:hypothetical protein
MNSTIKILIGLILLVLTFGFFLKETDALGGTGTINQLEQWKKVGNYITQNTASTTLKLTGYESGGDCLVTDANGIVSTAPCGTGSATNFWNYITGFLSPATTTDTVRANNFVATSTIASTFAGGIVSTIANAADKVGLTVTQNDTTNNPVGVSVTNAGTGNGLNITQSGIGKALNVTTNSTSGASPLTKPLASFSSTNATYDQWLMELNNAGTMTALDIQQQSPLNYHENGLSVVSNIDQTTIQQGFVIFWQKGASSTDEVLEVVNDGIGDTAYINTNNNAYGLRTLKDYFNISDSKNSIFVDEYVRVSDGNTISKTGAAVFIRRRNQPTDIGTINDSGNILDVRQENTNGTGITIYGENRGSGDTASLLANNGGRGIFLDQNANAESMYIDSEATSDSPLFISAQNTSGSTVYVLDEGVHGTGSTGSLMRLQMNNASSSAPVIRATNNGTGDGVFVDQNGAGKGFNIDKDVTNTNNTVVAAQIDHTSVVTDAGTYTKTGSALQINSNVTETSGTTTDSAQVLDINQTHADATGNIIDISSAGTGVGILVDGSGTGYSAIFNNGNVGIGTTTPSSLLTVNGNTLTANLTATGTIAIGTTTPKTNATLSVASTSPYIHLTDTNSATNTKHALLGYNDGIFTIGTTSDSGVATSSALTIRPGLPASLGIGTSTSAAGMELVGTLFAHSLTASAGTPSSVCQNATTKEITVNAALTCTVSARDQKANIKGFDLNALDMVMQLKPSTFFYKDDLARDRLGFIADEVQAVDPRLGDAYKDGEARSIDLPALTALNTKAIQELYAMTGEAKKSAQDSWQWIALLALLGLVVHQQVQINRLKK